MLKDVITLTRHDVPTSPEPYLPKELHGRTSGILGWPVEVETVRTHLCAAQSTGVA